MLFDFPKFVFSLPEELIAQTPSQKREHSRLMKFDRENSKISDYIFEDLPDLLRKGDLLVLNNTKVFPARLWGELAGSGREIELLLLKHLGKEKWRCLTKPAKYLKQGTELRLQDQFKGEVVETGVQGLREIQFKPLKENLTLLEYADKAGKMPLPPYIQREEILSDKERYQTVFARHIGAAAAPTAGLHFSEELINELNQHGIETVFITLHVGLGTFRPLTENEWKEGKLHSEEFEISQESVERINLALKEKRRVIAVGTTSVRALESAARLNFPLKPIKTETDLFITPGFKFKVIHGMITNFHLPNSSLLWLVSALVGEEKLRRCYEAAIEKKYRFYSYGDAMLIL